MNSSDALTGFVDQLNDPASSFSTYFNASSASEALKWTDVVQDAMYQIVSTSTVNTHACAIDYSVSPES